MSNREEHLHCIILLRFYYFSCSSSINKCIDLVPHRNFLWTRFDQITQVTILVGITFGACVKESNRAHRCSTTGETPTQLACVLALDSDHLKRIGHIGIQWSLHRMVLFEFFFIAF